MEHKSKSNQTSAARRRLLKSAAVGGGIVAGSRALPDSWTKPIMASVMTPAHAQTSPDPVTGVFTVTGLEGGLISSLQKVRTGPQYAILNALIPSAQASLDVGNAVCLDQDDGPPFRTFDMIFRVNEDQTVDIAIGQFPSDGGDFHCSGSSTIDGANAIADTSVNIGQSFDTADCFIDLSNMSATNTELTGSWAFNIGTNDGSEEPVNCFGDFTAPLTGTFPPTVIACAGEEVFFPI